MRSGKLNETITLSRVESVSNDYGGVEETLVEYATLRAQIIEESTEEFIRGWGASTERLRIFRTRWRDDVGVADVLTHDGRTYNMKQIKPIGRRRGLELRCVAVG
jgi:SPP1 family predicted phage head-tail adaptor